MLQHLEKKWIDKYTHKQTDDCKTTPFQGDFQAFLLFQYPTILQ